MTSQINQCHPDNKLTLKKLQDYHQFIQKLGGIFIYTNNIVNGKREKIVNTPFQHFSKAGIRRLQQINSFIDAFDSKSVADSFLKFEAQSFIEFLDKSLNQLELIYHHVDIRKKQKNKISSPPRMNTFRMRSTSVNTQGTSKLPLNVIEKIFEYKDKQKLLTPQEKMNKDLVNLYHYLHHKDQSFLIASEKNQQLTDNQQSQKASFQLSTRKQELLPLNLTPIRRKTQSMCDNPKMSQILNSWIDLQYLYNDSHKIGVEYTKLEQTIYKEMSNLQQKTDTVSDIDVSKYFKHDKLEQHTYYHHKPMRYGSMNKNLIRIKVNIKSDTKKIKEVNKKF